MIYSEKSKKHLIDFYVVENLQQGNDLFLLKVKPTNNILPPISGGSFVEILVKDSSTTFLRRPISVNYIDKETNTLWLLIKKVGDGTNALSKLVEGDKINILVPLGNGFSFPDKPNSKILLIGGGVGIAPLLYWGKCLKESGFNPYFLLGGRRSEDITETEIFESIGQTYYSTENGSLGTKGFVTGNPIINQDWDNVYCCGPLPMMKAVASIFKYKTTECEVSLENKMACGLGACLCCVEDTKDGHKCVCTDGPVFNIKELKW